MKATLSVSNEKLDAGLDGGNAMHLDKNVFGKNLSKTVRKPAYCGLEPPV